MNCRIAYTYSVEEFMIATLTMKLKKENDITYQISSLLHGFLMTNVNYEYGEFLHRSSLKPYSQHLEIGKDECLWVVSTLNQKAYENIIKPMLSETVTSVYLANRDRYIDIISKELSIISYEELLNQTFFFNCSKYINIKFTTPTAFKSDGEYIFYPNIRHIFNSLIRKYDTSNENTQIYTPELLDDIIKYVHISKYNLKSTYFSLEGIKIPAFVGEITIKINGPQQFANLMHLLVRFGEHSGVGIKSAIGMGCVKIIERENKYAGKTV